MCKARMADEVIRGMESKQPVAKYVPAIAPILMVAVGYMDPGNWASAIEGGSRFGFELLWVLVLSNCMAALFQTLATRLGLVTGKHLAQICRDDYPKPVCLLLWILSEVSIVALDLTMVLGTAVGLNLLLRIPILLSVLLLALDSVIFLVILPIVGVQRAEFFTGSVVGVVLFCFGLDTLLSRPSLTTVVGGMWPKIRGDTLYTAVGLLGANVMPHTFYLHSALVQRQNKIPGQSLEIVCQENMWDTIGAFVLALLGNTVILAVAATTFHNVGLVVLTLQDAHSLMEQILSNSMAPAVFGLALLCAGQLSTLTGTLTGKVTLEGFLDWNLQPWVHRSLVRGLAIPPAAFCVWHYGSEGLYQLLVFSQVVIALQLPFTAVPLIKASASEARMGTHRISLLVETVAWLSVALVIVANIWLAFDLLLEEVDEFAGFAAHLENLLGTDSFGSYGGETLNTSVFAFTLVGVGLCVAFLVWLIVTPLRVDRLAMERKWVEEYERFERIERNEDILLGNSERLRVRTGFEYQVRPNNIIAESNKVEIERANNDLPAWRVPASSTSSSHLEDSSAKVFEILKLPDGPQVHASIPALDVINAGELYEPMENRSPEVLTVEDGFLYPENSEGSGEEYPFELLEPTLELQVSSKTAIPDDPAILEDSGAPLKVLDIIESVDCLSLRVEDGKRLAQAKDFVPPTELETPVSGGRLARLPSTPASSASVEVSSLSANSLLAPMVAAKVEQDPSPAIVKVSSDALNTADDVESIALKNAEAEADADLLEKEEDEADGWENLEHEDVVVETLSMGCLGGSLGNLAYEGPGSARSVGGRSDTSEGNGGGSGSGSLSRLSGLGRSARRQFAAILDDFWGRLFDLHGQPINWKGGSGSGRRTGCAVAAGVRVPQLVDRGALQGRSGSEIVDREGNGYLVRQPKWGVTKTTSLIDQVGQMDAYLRAHSHATASTSSTFAGYSPDYSSRSASFSEYPGERQYSSLRFPSYCEEFDKQPATIHGYQSPSFLGRSATSSPAYKSSRPMHLDRQGLTSSRSHSGQSLAQQPLGIGVEKELEGSQFYGRGFRGDWQNSLENTIQSLRSSHHAMNSLAGRSPLYQKVNGDGDMHMSDAGPRSWDALLERATLDPLVYRATGELHIPSSSGRSPIGRVGGTPGERAPLSFDQISPSQSRRDGFSIQSAQPENSLWSRHPFGQLFGGAAEGSPARVRAGYQGSGRNGRVGRPAKAAEMEGITSATSFTDGTDFEGDMLENLHICLDKLLRLDGSEWLFRVDNGSDEDLIAAVATAEKMFLEADSYDRLSRMEQVHGRPVALLLKGSSEPRRVCYCGEACVWGRGLLISFGVWCVHRVLELSLMESRPELWGKYTYVLNRLQGILEPAFSKPRTVSAGCGCLLEAASVDNLGKRGRNLNRQGSTRDFLHGDTLNHLSSAQPYPSPWPWGRNSSSSKGRGATAAVFLEMIKEVEAAVGSRKGRTGTAAGDVAFPKGKENLASVLKRYKRRLGNKPPGSSVGGARAGGAGGSGGGGAGGGRRSSGYGQALLFAAGLFMVLLPPMC